MESPQSNTIQALEITKVPGFLVTWIVVIQHDIPQRLKIVPLRKTGFHAANASAHVRFVAGLAPESPPLPRVLA